MSDNRTRAQALRAKAKSTEFPAERAALLAKADELDGKAAETVTRQASAVRLVNHPRVPGVFRVEVDFTEADIVEPGYRYEW